MTGLDSLFCYANDVTFGYFMPLVVFAVFVVLVVGMYNIQKKASGYGDLPQTLSVGSFTTTVFCIILRLIQCDGARLISNLTLAVSIGATLLSLVFLFFSND